MIEFHDLVALSHPLFRYGMPERVDRFIPVRTESHFILFDRERVGPHYVMFTVNCETDDKVVDRDDDFVSEFTLPESLQTRISDYRQWNKDHPDDPMDCGHQCGSQYRRSDALLQHDVDSLAGCCPETPSLNRHVKGPLENAIVKKAKQMIDCRVVSGPIWFDDSPRGKLRSGQWIPDGFFLSTLWRPNMTDVHSESFVMENSQDRDAVGMHEVSLDELETLTGLRLWARVQNTSFVRSRSETRNEDWWK